MRPDQRHERAVDLLARAAFVLHRVDGALPHDLTGGARSRYVEDTRGWLLACHCTPGTWATYRIVENETTEAIARVCAAEPHVVAARRALEADMTTENRYPLHLGRVVLTEIISLQGDIADLRDDTTKEAAA